MVVVLDPKDVGRVLAEAPTPFHPANREKRKALQWFQPHGVLISAGPAECTGRNLVLFITSTLLAHMLHALRFELASTPKPSPDKPLPMTLNQLTLDFAVAPVRPAVSIR